MKGYIADTYLGRYRTILYFCVIYLVGLGVFLIGSIPTNLMPALVFLGMYLVALGSGGIKPNVSTMGADQFDVTIEQDLNESKMFFSYFYWAINLGAFVSYTLVAYICQYGISFLGGEDWGFFIGYMIPTIMLTIGVAIFIGGSAKYKKNIPEGSIINKVAGLLYESLISNRHITVDKQTNITERLNISGSESEHEIDKEINERRLWLDRASTRYGGKYI